MRDPPSDRASARSFRLQALKPRLSTLAPRLGYASGDDVAFDRHRDRTQHWRQWYKTGRWQSLRRAILVRDGYTCRKCGTTASGRKGEVAADHIKPHRGDPNLFWDPANLQCLCTRCHSSAKQLEERRWAARP